MLPASIRAVFFDAVGTLIHTAEPPARTYAAVAARYGIALYEDAIGRRFRAAFRIEEDRDRAAGWITSEAREVERWRSIVTAALGDERCFPELWDHFALASAWTVDPLGARLVHRLADHGIATGIASNLDSRLDRVVAGIPELEHLSPNIVVSSRVGYRKPHGAFFAEVARIAGTPPESIAFVGDDPVNDFDGANAAGMMPYLIDPNALHTDRVPRVASLVELL